MIEAVDRSLLSIVSGGQTGIDRAALDVALELGIACGGWCPRGRRAEDGRIPDRYPLRETASRSYPDRTARNVEDADATLVLTHGRLSGGTALTAALARRRGKPCLVVDLGLPPEPAAVAAWMAERGVRVLNVAGPRESEAPGIGDEARHFLVAVLTQVGG